MEKIKFINIKKAIVLLLVFIFLFSVNGVSFASSNIMFEDIIDELTSEDFVNIYLEVKNDETFKELNLEQKNNYVKNKILKNYLLSKNRPNNNLITPRSLRSHLPKEYKKLNNEEKKLVVRYPGEAILYYGASKVAEKETIRRFKANRGDDASDAFRHTYWNALLVNLLVISQIEGNYSDPDFKYAVTAAKRWTTAHEANSFGLAKQMDLYNNALGRSIGYDLAPTREYKLSNAVYNAI